MSEPVRLAIGGRRTWRAKLPQKFSAATTRTPLTLAKAASSPHPATEVASKRATASGRHQMFEWVDCVHSVLAVAGPKRGAARDRIIDVLADQRRALTASEIEDILRNRSEATARAGIYRVLDLLVEHGLGNASSSTPGRPGCACAAPARRLLAL